MFLICIYFLKSLVFCHWPSFQRGDFWTWCHDWDSSLGFINRGISQIEELMFFFSGICVWPPYHSDMDLNDRPGSDQSQPNCLSNMGRVLWDDCTEESHWGIFINYQDGCRWCVIQFIVLIVCRSIQLRRKAFWSAALITILDKTDIHIWLQTNSQLHICLVMSGQGSTSHMDGLYFLVCISIILSFLQTSGTFVCTTLRLLLFLTTRQGMGKKHHRCAHEEEVTVFSEIQMYTCINQCFTHYKVHLVCTVPQAIYISVQPEDTSANVRWDIKAEDICSTAVQYFIVFYRQTDKDLLYSKFTKSVIVVLVDSVKLCFSTHISKSKHCVSAVLVYRPICQ